MLYLVRHGQTAANADALIQGTTDFELNEVGWRQARALAAALPRQAHIVASPLKRALQTAEPIAAGRPVTVDSRWIEMEFGELEGQRVADARDVLWANWDNDPAWTPAGGESLTDVYDRVAEACEDLRATFEDEDVIVVSHVSPIKAAIAWTLGVSPRIAGRMFVEQASIATVVIGRDDRKPLLRSFNELVW